jgi:hypothetical protein
MQDVEIAAPHGNDMMPLRKAPCQRGTHAPG